MRDLDLIEACYSTMVGDEAWGTSLAEALARLIPNAAAVMAASYRVSPGEGGRFVQIVGDARYMDMAAAVRCSLPMMDALNRSPEGHAYLRGSFGAGSPMTLLLSEIPQGYQAILRSNLPWRDAHMLGLFGTLDGTHGFALAAGGPESLPFSRRRRAQLLRLCEHVAAGYWLRRLLAPVDGSLEDAAEAIYTPDGRVLQQSRASAEPNLGERLVDAVRRMDRARCRRQKRSPEEATELWQALVAGQYALVESLERNGRRVILAVRCRSPRPALTSREAAVANAAAEGLGNKQVAERLGISPSTVAVHLGVALRKLRCPSRRALAHWLPARGARRS